MSMLEKLLQIDLPQIKHFIDLYVVQSTIKKVALSTFLFLSI